MSKPEIEVIGCESLVEKCAGFRKDGCRLVQISCTKTADAMELTYSFDKDGRMFHVRVYWTPDMSVPSIQSVYSCAFIYENEISELFGVKIDGMAVDLSGKLYKTAVQAPFGGSITIQGV